MYSKKLILDSLALEIALKKFNIEAVPRSIA
ncbi:hypothetical protein Arcpr_0074 [Archaeoglobus profundus DSM 5631]|uniref:Uncharacterized protein n=1 Tax=Archaeoglobus profundus (strain DSM 5631 / JCM 9629 / NBRC 100127 / Av18) TaxID=572546 RepID=D2RFS5_ARCPA|nr:hypothetical protein Arcpr_0074 [Archaeoglobus profundus DSM 5631]